MLEWVDSLVLSTGGDIGIVAVVNGKIPPGSQVFGHQGVSVGISESKIERRGLSMRMRLGLAPPGTADSVPPGTADLAPPGTAGVISGSRAKNSGSGISDRPDTKTEGRQSSLTAHFFFHAQTIDLRGFDGGDLVENTHFDVITTWRSEAGRGADIGVKAGTGSRVGIRIFTAVCTNFVARTVVERVP